MRASLIPTRCWRRQRGSARGSHPLGTPCLRHGACPPSRTCAQRPGTLEGHEDELDKYLALPVEKNTDLDVLAWWKAKDNQKDGLPILAKMAHQFLGRPASSAATEWLPIGCADHQWRRDAQCWKLVVGEHWQRLQREEAWRRAQPTAAKRDIACSVARCARVPVQYCTGIRISDYPKFRRLFCGIWIYLDHPHQLSVSTRWQNSHYPVNPDGAGASRIHALYMTHKIHARYMSDTKGYIRGYVSRALLAGHTAHSAQCTV